MHLHRTQREQKPGSKPQKKAKARKIFDKKRESWEAMRDKGIQISDARLDELEELRTSVLTAPPVPLKQVFAVNIAQTRASDQLFELPYITFFNMARGGVSQDSSTDDAEADYETLKRVLKQEYKNLEAQALVVEFEGFFNKFDRAVLAAATFLKLPVIILAGAKVAEDVLTFTGGVWKVFGDADAFVQSIKADLPGLVAVCSAVSEDVASKVEKYKHVEPLQHGLKRSAVAFIPFGVYAVNFVGIARLVRRMLKKTGMLSDNEAKKAATFEAAISGVTVSLIDGVGDVYQMVITATLLAGFFTEVSAAGLEAGLASLSALDFALMGSITVVTGTISAVAAYIARPKMVEAIATLITTLQLVCLLSPGLRRAHPSDADEAAAGEGGAGAAPPKPAVDKKSMRHMFQRAQAGDVAASEGGGEVQQPLGASKHKSEKQPLLQSFPRWPSKDREHSGAEETKVASASASLAGAGAGDAPASEGSGGLQQPAAAPKQKLGMQSFLHMMPRRRSAKGKEQSDVEEAQVVTAVGGPASGSAGGVAGAGEQQCAAGPSTHKPGKQPLQRWPSREVDQSNVEEADVVTASSSSSTSSTSSTGSMSCFQPLLVEEPETQQA